MVGIELRRKLSCPKCKRYDWHLSVIGVDHEKNTCLNCGWVWEIVYQVSSKLYDQTLQFQLARVRDAITQASLRVNGHSWSKNQVVRDKAKLEQVKVDLEYALGVLNTLMGE